MTDDPKELMEEVLDDIVAKPISVVTVKDGWVFSFSRDLLAGLLKRSEETGKVVVFVKNSGG